MDIAYTEEKKFSMEQVQELFRSVGWVSGEYPQRLYKALMHSSRARPTSRAPSHAVVTRDECISAL